MSKTTGVIDARGSVAYYTYDEKYVTGYKDALGRSQGFQGRAADTDALGYTSYFVHDRKRRLTYAGGSEAAASEAGAQAPQRTELSMASPEFGIRMVGSPAGRMVGLPAGLVATADRPAVGKGELHGVVGGAGGSEAAGSEAGAQAPQCSELSMASLDCLDCYVSATVAYAAQEQTFVETEVFLNPRTALPQNYYFG
jgi:hypothetical protein